MANGLFTLKQQLQGAIQYSWSGQKTPAVEYLVVAGGGAGGDNSNPSNGNGGGGAGGLLQGITPITPSATFVVTIGAGSGRFGNKGCNSLFGPITAIGGGTGARFCSHVAYSGGSGAGGASACSYSRGAAGYFGQGNTGGSGLPCNSGGGGGGAGSVGANGTASSGGNGGMGIASAISGTVTTYAGGGAGGAPNGFAHGLGGVGGGASATGGCGTSGSANTGGGGAPGCNNTSAGSGGSGIVIISYPDVYSAPVVTTGSPTASTSGSGSFTSSGSIQAGGGSGGFLIYPATNQSSFAFGTSNFTIEFFIYPTPGFQNAGIIYDARPSGVQGLYPTILLDTNGTIYYYTNSANQITGSTLSLNTWYHIALTRFGASTKLFVNGTQVGSTYSDSNTYLNQYPFFGGSGYSIGSNYFQGYMTNARVNNTTALYTSNFVVPTSPLTNQAGTICLLSSVSGAFLIDTSPNQALFRAAGTPYWSQLSPFATGLGYKNRVYTWTSSGSIIF